MATITKTFTENSESSYKSTWTMTFKASDVTASFSTVNVDANLTAKYTYTDKKRAWTDISSRAKCVAHGTTYTQTPPSNNWKWGEAGNMDTWWSGYTRTGTNQYSFATSDLFKSSNSTVRTLAVSLEAYYQMGSAKNDDYDWENMYDSNAYASVGTIANITLDAPPSFTASAISYDTAYVYAGLTTASVTISSASAQYGGSISASSFTIGSQTVTGNGNGTLSILLANEGTFTPTVTVTDSRGQVTTQTLSPITVNGYSRPTVDSLTADRTDQNGAIDDEGQCAVVTASFSWASAIADLNAPTVSITDQNGASVTATTTWYKNSSLTTAISDWTALTSSDMPVYAFIDNSGHNTFNTQYSYQITITPNDSIDSGTAISTSLDSAFYTVDFLAGGHGIAFGQPASQTGFFCNMDAHFVDANSVMRALFDFVYPVGSYYETSDTTFNPNTTWGGTWVLETEGQVHISAGTNYSVAGALTNTTDGGEATHTLIESELPTITGTARVQAYNTATASGHFNLTNKNFNLRSASSGTANAFGSVDLNLSFGSNGAHNNMQPYIIVKRWHRTA